jgi:protein-tyrosine phosphatase
MLKILNFRPLAKDAINKNGKSLKPKTIFRSGAIAYAAKTDIMKIKSLGIRDIYDFRNHDELNAMPTLSNPALATHHFDILKEAAHADTEIYLKLTREQLNDGVLKMYRDSFGTTDGYKGAILQISEQKNPQFLFHCTAGKDRTGIFGAILMMILDFDSDAIKKEYLTIDKRAMRILGHKMLKKTGLKPKDVDTSKFDGIMGVLPEFIDAYMDRIISDYKEIDTYLFKKVGVTPEIKALFQERYLV